MNFLMSITCFLFLLGFEAKAHIYGSATYVQKLGGYDAPATNATAIALGLNF